MAKTLEKKIDFGFAGYKKTKGTIVLHFKEGATSPCGAEVFPDFEPGGDYHTEYGLFFKGRTLDGYDAAGFWEFMLPEPLALWMRELGYQVDDIHFINPFEEKL